MSSKVVAAIITGVVSLLVAIISAFFASRANRRVAELTHEFQRQRLQVENELLQQRLHLTSELEEQRAIKDARRDYEYDAKKRLYAECEPLVFQALELAESARFRIISLARSAKLRDLRSDGSGWLARRGYYFKSTVFMLLAPITTFKILQRRLTAIDLRLEPRLQTQYEMLKLLFRLFTEDHKLATLPPKLRYDPDRADPEQPDAEALLREVPTVYSRQGFYLGTLELVAGALIDETKEVARPKAFGEFLSDWDDHSSRINLLVSEFTNVFGGFHPERKPVLWRILIAQVLVYNAFLRSQCWAGADQSDSATPVAGQMEPRIDLFDWRSADAGLPDESIREPFLAASGLNTFRERCPH